MTDFTFGSLFAGVGGLDLGLERAGMRCGWQVEIDDYCTWVLEKHWPNVQRYGDVRECGSHNLAPVDLICGGFPCQDVSHAGERKGLKEGTRTGLWYEFARIIRELRPRWVLAENVPGLLSVDSGRGMGTVLRDLAACGYDAEWDCIPAAAFGAPHLRYRVFIVAHHRGSGRWQDARSTLGNEGQNERRTTENDNQPASHGEGCRASDVAHARCKPTRPESRRPNGERQATSQAQNLGPTKRDGFTDSSKAVAYAQGEPSYPRIFSGSPKEIAQAELGGCGSYTSVWAVEPDVGGRLDGFPLWLERHIGKGMSYAESKRAVEVLRNLWSADAAQTLRSATRGLGRFQTAEVLFTFLRKYEAHPDEARLFLAGKETPDGFLRSLRLKEKATGTPHRPGHNEQRARQHTDTLQEVPRFLAQHMQENWPFSGWEDGIPRVATGVPARVDRLRALGNAVVPQLAEWLGRRILRADMGIMRVP